MQQINTINLKPGLKKEFYTELTRQMAKLSIPLLLEALFENSKVIA